MAMDMFLKITGVNGESQDKTHKDEIQIESVSWGAAQQGTFSYGTGAGTGKVSMQDLHITKFIDKASADLFLSCCNGKHFDEAVLVMRKAGESPIEYLKVTFSSVMVTSINYSGGGGGDRTVEQVSLAFAKYKQEYFVQGNKGDPTAAGNVGWDLQTNEKV